MDLTMTPGGFTGVGITPNAHLLPWGALSLQYDNQLPGFANPDGHNLVVGFGMLPSFELSARIASNSVNQNCFMSACGARDLSGNVKAGIGLDADHRWRVAVGASDVGGQANFARSYYGVLTYGGDWFDASVGLARRGAGGVVGSRSPLHGPFGSLVVQPFSWLQAHAEYSDRNGWLGAKLFAPKEWLPHGWRAHVGANVSVRSVAPTERTWFNLGLTIPLYDVPQLPGQAARSVERDVPRGFIPDPTYQPQTQSLVPAWVGEPPLVLRMIPTLQSLFEAPREQEAVAQAPVTRPSGQAGGATPPSPAPVAAAQLRLIAAALAAKGLEDIFVGRLPGGGVAVRVNNATYNWNALDALGVSLGVIARELASANVAYRLVLTQRQIPLVGFGGQAGCLQQWIEGTDVSCTAGQIHTAGTVNLESLLDGAVWEVQREEPSWKTLRISVAPALRTGVATEYGVLDYSLGARIAFQQPLWNGAYAELRQTVPIADTNDFKGSGVFSGRRLENRTNRLLFSQTLPLASLSGWVSGTQDGASWLRGLTAQVDVGRVNDYYDGALGQLRWEPGEGNHRFGLQGGRFRKDTASSPAGAFREPRLATPLLGSYRYRFIPTRTDFEATVGEFMNNDRGTQLVMRQWFSDIAVGLYYKRTAFPNVSARQFVGLEISLPLTARKDMNAGSLLPHLQVTGAQRFSSGVETLIRESTNTITVGHAVRPDVPTLDSIFNSDRLSRTYVADNMRRIREAARGLRE